MKVISLGWGVQSFALAAMSALGVLPKVDAAIHADTTHERAETYALAKRWTPWLEERGVRVVTVNGGRPVIGTDVPSYTSIPAHAAEIPVVNKWGDPDIPVHVLHADGLPAGMLRRQCTHDWKIAPIRRWLQKHRKKQQVEQWIGITLDEITRMRVSDVKYQVLAFPFIEMLDRPWTRGMVMRWLQDNDLEIPVKSSCIFCPYHDRATWREIKRSGTGDWEKAVTVDEAIRHKRPGYLCYLTAARKPLVDCDFRSQEDHGQLTLWDEECQGMCFL